MKRTMAEFRNLQSELHEARAALRSRARAAFVGDERVRRSKLSEASVQRTNNPDSAAYSAWREGHARTQRAAAAARSQKDRARVQHDALLAAFQAFTDPRQNLGQLPDSH